MLKILKLIGKTILWIIASLIGVIVLVALVVAVRYWIWTPVSKPA